LRLADSKAVVFAFRIAVVLSVLLPSQTRAERLPIKTYTTADGLPRDRVNHIAQDSKGFLWFCTSEGLSRFDGYKFTNYGIESGLAGRVVTDFLEARNGYYWVATSRGLCRFIPDASPPRAEGAAAPAPRKFLTYYTGETPQSSYINGIYEDHAGTIWCSTERGLFRVDQSGADTVVSLVDIIQPGDPATGVPLRVNSVTEDGHGSLWINAASGLYRVRPGRTLERYTGEEGLPIGYATFLFSDRDGLLWLGSRLGLYQFVPDPTPHRSLIARRYTAKDGWPGYDVYSMCQSSDGTMWIGTSVGLSKFVWGKHEQSGLLQNYAKANGLIGANSLCEDRDHNLWIGTESGAIRLGASGFVTYSEADGLGGPGPAAAHIGATRVGSIFEDQARELCVIGGAAPNVVINKFDGARFAGIPLALPHGLSYWGWGWYQVTFQDHSGEWWMTTGQGLVRFPRSTKLQQLPRARPQAIYKARDGLGSDEIFRLYEDSRGDIWISTLGNTDCVLTRWERATGTFHRYFQTDGIPDHAPTAFCDDGAGNLWIGFYEGGLVRYRAGRFTQFKVADGVPPGFVQGFYVDHAGRLWVATNEGGVARIDHPADDRPSFLTYSTADGLSSNQANSITEDRWGMIYVGTGRGVDKLDPATGHIRHYTVADGLAASLIGVSYRDRNGSLWFGTLQGVSRLDPQPNQPASPPPIFITALRVAGVPYPISELGAASIAGPELTANQNNVQIEFAGLSFAAGESLRYQYKLEGTSLDWSAPSDQRVITYPNLPPGSYRFLVRAVRSDGTLSQSPAAASFTILRPIWRRWWFLLAAGLAVATTGFALASSRVARMRAARESDRRFRTLAETASDAIITIDEQGRIVLANQAAEKTFGYSIGEILGKDLTMLMPEYLRQLHREGFARYKQTGVRHISWEAIDLTGLHKNGSEIPLEISFGEFMKGERRFFTGIARDVTERKRAEEERKQAEAALRRSREERLAELEQVRRRIATDLHDDVGSSLSQVSVLSEVARQRARANLDPGEPLALIADISRGLLDSISDIVWAIKPGREHLSDLTLRMRRFAGDTTSAANVELDFNATDNEHDLKLGPDLRREIYLIFKESINNLIRHSGCTRANVAFTNVDSSLELVITDNGRGFDTDRATEGNGLASIRQRAASLGGTLQIDSRQEQGTTVRLVVPLDGHSGLGRP
jgi:PAS domain S-box-containing protein